MPATVQDLEGGYRRMNDPDWNRKRLTIRRRDGMTVYCASAWPGWRDIAATLIAFVIIAAILAGLLSVFYKVLFSFDVIFQYNTWLSRILRFIFIGSLDFTFVVILAFLLLWMPYWLIYQLSPKEFRLDDNHLCHTVRLFGLIRRTRRIPFDRIMEIKIAPSGSAFHLTAVYKMKLPRLIHFILVYWNEKLATWPLVLVNAIPTRREAEQVQFQLLEVMTKSTPRQKT
jgi:hypothetical protein